MLLLLLVVVVGVAVLVLVLVLVVLFIYLFVTPNHTRGQHEIMRIQNIIMRTSTHSMQAIIFVFEYKLINTYYLQNTQKDRRQ